jgi:hypothetical protein
MVSHEGLCLQHQIVFMHFVLLRSALMFLLHSLRERKVLERERIRLTYFFL